MGCVVNGPGEAREADLGIAAGRKRGHLFVKGQVVTVVPEDEMVDALVEWAEHHRRARGRGGPAPQGRLRRRRGRGRPGRPPRREGRRRQPRRRAHRAHPQARPVLSHRPDHPRSGGDPASPVTRDAPARTGSARVTGGGSAGGGASGGRLASAPYGQAARAHPPGRGLPPLVPGRRRQGGAGRQRPGAGHDGHPPVRLRHLGADAGRGRPPHQGRRRRERLLPAVHPRELPEARGRARRGLQPRAGRRHPRRRQGARGAGRRAAHLARPSSASSWPSGSRATATCRCC